MKKILLIEYDYELNQELCYALGKENYKISSAFSIDLERAKVTVQGKDCPVAPSAIGIAPTIYMFSHG